MFSCWYSRQVWTAACLAAIGSGACAEDDRDDLDSVETAVTTASVLFPANPTPSLVTVNDATSVELGVKFRSSTAGYVTGFRFYKGPRNTGSHPAHLWSSSGALLASATFANETASGWQQVNLSSPVAIAANTTYVASYHSSGFYSANSQYFATAVSAPPLTAPTSSSSGGNGVYAYGSGTSFPTSTYQATNYWIDVMFSTAVNRAPVATNDAGFATSRNVPVTIPAASLLANDTDPDGDSLAFASASNPVHGTVGFNASAKAVTFTPATGYTGAASFTYTISDGHGHGASASASLTVNGGGGCSAYASSGPVVATADNQIIQNLNIKTTGGPGIDTNGHSGVQIKNVTVHHSGANPGILVRGGTGVTISGADVVNDGAPASGANPSPNMNNIECYQSSNMTVTNVRVTKGSSGIYMNLCSGSKLSFIEGHDHRGPFPRGQLVQWNSSSNGSLTDFSEENDVLTAWTEDNVNVYASTGITIARGLVDGNNSPSGIGVINDGTSGNVTVTDVDALHQGNGCFGVYGGGGHDVTFRNARCRDNHCSNPRGAPSSNALGYAIDPGSVRGNLHIIASAYYNLCNPGNVAWDTSMLATNQLTSSNFTPRAPIRAQLCP